MQYLLLDPALSTGHACGLDHTRSSSGCVQYASRYLDYAIVFHWFLTLITYAHASCAYHCMDILTRQAVHRFRHIMLTYSLVPNYVRTHMHVHRVNTCICEGVHVS